MKQFFKWLGKHIAGALVFSLFSILFIAGIVYALTFPSAPPAGEIAGGKFMQYFNSMFTGCSGNWVIKSFSSLGIPICTYGGVNAQQITSQIGYNTTSTTWIDYPGMALSTNTYGWRPILLYFTTQASNSAAFAFIAFRFIVDGVPVTTAPMGNTAIQDISDTAL